jgi:hypothetical protein
VAARRRLGRGRSGTVYAGRGPDGRQWATKVFVPDRASSLVMNVLTGAVNPYRWHPHAVKTAVLRRRLLEPLVGLWFGDALRLPRTGCVRWNEEAKAFELEAELIDGRHAMLRHPTAGPAAGEVRGLARDILRPLQRHLAEAGFDGLLWQAGRGNPVAAANFMREQAADGSMRWVWIDAESGVPALFSPNPWHQVRTYLPLSIKHGRWLFDDVDVHRLRAYLREHDSDLRARHADEVVQRMGADVDALEAAQDAWRSMGRHARSVESRRATGRITDEVARRYATRPVRWMLRLGVHAGLRTARKVGSAARAALRRLRPRPVMAALGRWTRFFLSQSVRERWAGRTVRRRLRDWRARRFLSAGDARRIRRSMKTSDAAEYLADFGVHLAMKPAVKLLSWGLVPLLGLLGVIDSWWIVGLLAVYGGALARTLYTLGRTVQAALRGRQLPVVALAAGLLPVFGNSAYVLQLLTTSSQKDGHVAKFMVHDLFSAIGRRVPIWGGKDTLTEHRINALATLLTR